MSSEAECEHVAPKASCLCYFQGGMQAFVRPGAWIPCVRSLHTYEEKWLISANPSVCCQDVQQAVSQLRARSLGGNIFVLSHVKEEAEKCEVEILVFSRARYVFVIQATFEAAQQPAGSLATMRAFSSGILPAWFPASFFFSCLLFFLPYPDFGYSATWLTLLRRRMTIPVEVTSSGRKC